MSKIIFYYGTMKSAKSMNLLCSRHSLLSQNKQVTLVKPLTDSRQENKKISSRTGLSAEADILLSPIEELPEIPSKYIFIDEAQFLSEKNINDLKSLEDKVIFCYGLRTDFQSKLFIGSKRLLELADVINEIKASCDYCDDKAQFHIRLNEAGEKIRSGPSIYPGYDYKSVCWRHYND